MMGLGEHPAQEDLRLILYIDGASKGNPGRAGAGVWMTNGEGKKLVEMSRYLGHKTNNEAEYWALLLGLREAKRLGGKSIRVFTDSELIERQVKGLYRVKEFHLKRAETQSVARRRERSGLFFVSRQRGRASSLRRRFRCGRKYLPGRIDQRQDF